MLYPINLNLDNLEITIIGGGEVSYRKCTNFLDFGTKVKVVSSDFIEKFYELSDNVELVKDIYKEEYIKSSFIVVAATNNKKINEEIGIYCRNNGKLVNVVDNIRLCNYTVPSYIRRGDLLLSVSTGGKSPSLSYKIKKELENKYDDSYEEYIDLLGKIRNNIIIKYKDIHERKSILNMLVNLNLEELRDISKKYI